VPETWVQATVLLGLVVPGFVYQVSAQTVAGPDPAQSELGTRVLRAIVSTAAFAGGYAALFGRTIVAYVREPALALAEVPALGAQFVVLALLVPWLGARLRHRVVRSSTYRRVVAWRLLAPLHLDHDRNPTPTAWDRAFADRGTGWVRVRMADGRLVGGWYGSRSSSSSYPHPHELDVEEGWQLEHDGAFSPVRSAPGGTVIDCRSAVTVDFIPADRDTAAGGSDEHEDGVP
jgi:hypothetical protein